MTASYADRVQETTATTGTGTITLAGAVSGYQSFTTAFGANVTVNYCITSGTAWEVGQGVFTNSGTTLTRPAANVLAGSSGVATNITLAGTSNVFLVTPANLELVTSFATSTTWTAPASGTLEVIGCGGGGGGVGGGAASGAAGGEGGGGAWQGAVWITVVAGTTYTITIGAGGSGGGAGAGNGSPGGTTSFDVLAYFNGASGGNYGAVGMPFNNNGTNVVYTSSSLAGAIGISPGMGGIHSGTSAGGNGFYNYIGGYAGGTGGTSTGSIGGGGGGGAGPRGAGGNGGNGVASGAGNPGVSPAANTGAGGGGGGGSGTGGSSGGIGGTGGSGYMQIRYIS